MRETIARHRLPDRDTFYQLYMVERLPVEVMAERYGVTAGAVQRAASRYGLKRGRSRRPPTDAQLSEIKRLFDAGQPMEAIAEQVGFPRYNVRRIISRQGWTRRRPRRRRIEPPSQ